MKLFLWGAPCAETIAMQMALAERGYVVRSLYDIKAENRFTSPHDLKRLRALEVVQAEAIVIEGTTAEIRECARFCRDMGVPLLLADELPKQCPIELDNTELIDSLNWAYRIGITGIQRRA